MSVDPVAQAVSFFAALPLAEKVEALAAAAIKVENDLERNGRGLGHPSDRPWDYQAVIVSEMLGLRWTTRDDQGALIDGGYPRSWFLKRAGLSLSDVEERLFVGSLAVVASASPENRFAGIIEGSELNPEEPAGLAVPVGISEHGPFAKMLQASGAYRKVFVGSFSFVDALSPDHFFSDRAFHGLCHVKKQFRYAQADIIVYAAGVEFPC